MKPDAIINPLSIYSDTDIVRECKKHGALTKKDVHKKGFNSPGKIHWACTLCKRENAKVSRQNNYEKIRAKQIEYDQLKRQNPEWKEKRKVWDKSAYKRRRAKYTEQLKQREKEWQANARAKNPEKYKNIQKKMRDELRAPYIRRYLKEIGFVNPSQELIEAKTALIRLKREIIKTNPNHGKNRYVTKTRKSKKRSEREIRSNGRQECTTAHS